MLRVMGVGAALAVAAAAAPASAGPWGVGYGPPVYYDAPPRVLYGAPDGPPAFYDGPRAYRRNGPVVIAPGSRILHMEAVEDVRGRLLDQGFRDLSRVKRRGARYFVRGVNPGGDLVALQISIFTGDIERVDLLEAGVSEPQRRGPRAAARARAEAPARAAPARPTMAARPTAPARPMGRAAEPEPNDQAEATTRPAPAAKANTRAAEPKIEAEATTKRSAPAKPAARTNDPAPQVQADATGKSDAGASTLRGRLKVPPAEKSAQASKPPASSNGGSDPLVVY